MLVQSKVFVLVVESFIETNFVLNYGFGNALVSGIVRNEAVEISGIYSIPCKLFLFSITT